MAIKSFKPYTPSRRNMTVSAFDGVDKKAKPVPSLLQTVKKNAGRNSYGRITVRHRGGGNKRKTEEKRKAYEHATAALDAYLKAQSQKYQDPARHCSLDFTCPLPSVGRISTYFGEPDAVYNKPHTGADMPAASGTLIYAVADGVVSAASARPSYGNCVQIDHGTADDGSSYATLYAHMSSFCVSAGQTVHKGDVIGYVGNTGDVRGANGGYHLHLELRINGTRTDPLQYIPH